MVFDLNRGISPNVILLKIVGLWPFGYENLYNMYSYFILANMYWYNITSFMYLIKNIDDTEEVTATVYNLLSTVTAVLKANILHKKFRHLKSIVEMFEKPEFQPTNSEQRKILKNGIFWAKFVFYYFLILGGIALAMWVIFPILDKETRLPSNAWFPYDYLSKYYTVTYIWQGIFIVYHGLSNAGMDTMFAMLMIQLGAQCEALNDEIRSLGHTDTKNALEDLHRCIDKHKLLLTMADTIRLTFGNIVFVQFITSVLVLCETMFLLSLLTTFNATFVMLLLYQSALFTEIFLYCWFGNEVVVKSEKLYYSCFMCQWYDCPETFKKDLLFFMTRVKKPIIVYVGNIFPITVTTFTSILRSSWAYFMALREVHAKN